MRESALSDNSGLTVTKASVLNSRFKKGTSRVIEKSEKTIVSRLKITLRTA
jgi:hypothetical protein